MHIRRLSIIGMLAGGVTAAGCGGGGKSPVNPGSSASFVLGAHLDSLAVQAATAGNFDRYRLLSYPIAALMENLSPSSVSVSVDGSTQSYQAVMLELVGQSAGTTPAPAESLFAVAAWSDSNADELVFTEVALPDTLEDAEDLSGIVANGSVDSATVLSVALSSTSGSCHSFTLPVANEAVTDFLKSTSCSTGSGTASFSFYFTPGVNSHNVFIMNSQTINAVRLVLPPNSGGLERIRPKAGMGTAGVPNGRGG
jgi:hypothetical protein